MFRRSFGVVCFSDEGQFYSPIYITATPSPDFVTRAGLITALFAAMSRYLTNVLRIDYAMLPCVNLAAIAWGEEDPAMPHTRELGLMCLAIVAHNHCVQIDHMSPADRIRIMRLVAIVRPWPLYSSLAKLYDRSCNATPLMPLFLAAEHSYRKDHFPSSISVI